MCVWADGGGGGGGLASTSGFLRAVNQNGYVSGWI